MNTKHRKGYEKMSAFQLKTINKIDKQVILDYVRLHSRHVSQSLQRYPESR